MSSGHPEPDPRHRAFLSRAVAPNLYTSTLHPEFIPALVTANLMTPHLWHWAEQSMAGVDVANPTAALQAIHRFLNKKFYHANGHEYASIWGLQETRHVTDPEEREASEYAMRMIETSTRSPWAESLKPLLHDGLFPLVVYGTVDVLRVQGRRLGKRALGVTSCLDECALAVAIAIAAGVCRWEDVVFLGSPLHYTVYIRTPDGGVWMNAKREMHTRSGWAEHCAGFEEEHRAREMTEMIGAVDRVICAQGLAVFPHGKLSGNRDAVARAVAEVETFVQARLHDLTPLPEDGEEHRFAGWEVIAKEPESSAHAVQTAVLHRARQGGSPILEAALYMFRHPEYCHAEILMDAARKNYYTFLKSASAGTSDDIHAMVEAVPVRESLYGPTGRLAMPDEVLSSGMANEAERELMRHILHGHMTARLG